MNKPNCKFSIKEKYEEITNLILYGTGWPPEQSPVKQKPFDISGYEFVDSELLEFICFENKKLTLGSYTANCHLEIHKEDAIFIAKSHQLTAEDLK